MAGATILERCPADRTPESCRGSIQATRLIQVDLMKNSNKFWNCYLMPDLQVISHWGRVGDKSAAVTPLGRGTKLFQGKMLGKIRDGYEEQKTISDEGVVQANVRRAGKAVVDDAIERIALRDIRTDSPQTKEMLRVWSKVNAHQIHEHTRGSITYNVATGTMGSALGPVTAEGINDARAILDRVAWSLEHGYLEYSDGVTLLNRYLRIIPRDVGRKRLTAALVFPDAESIEKERELLDALEAALETMTPESVEEPRVFEVSLAMIEAGDPVFAEVQALYESSKKEMHQSYRLKARRMWSVDHAPSRAAFEMSGRRVGNVRRLWHGTRIANLLSIMKKGLTTKHASSGGVFGSGIYHALHSTKALNYSDGAWSGRKEGVCYMFLNEVATGTPYHPESIGNALPKGFDSIWARAGSGPGHVGSLVHDEIVVHQDFQVCPLYLIEFCEGSEPKVAA